MAKIPRRPRELKLAEALTPTFVIEQVIEAANLPPDLASATVASLVKEVARATEIVNAAPADPATFEDQVAKLKPMTSAELAQALDTSHLDPDKNAQAQKPADKPRLSAMQRFGIFRDHEQGIRVDRERERYPGVPYNRILISFRDKPSADERSMLKGEGFTFDPRIDSWGKESTAATTLLAKRLVNTLLKDRGVEAQLYV